VTTDISGTVADRQRTRAGRRAATPGAASQIAPPRQRRPALAALALLLIVGGALVAGLLAVRMDSRVPVLVAARDIEPGAKISADDLRTARVASEGLDLIDEEFAEDVVGTYATTSIPENTLLDQRMLATEDPVPPGRAIVSVPLGGKVAPGRIAEGDVVQVIRTTATDASSKPEVIGTGYVLEVSEPSTDELGASAEGPIADLLVLDDAALSVLDAVQSEEVALAITDTGQKPDIPLQGPSE